MFTKLVFAAVLTAVAVQPVAALADAAEEIATATDHAGYATTSRNIDAVHEHLHHAVNCLEGPGSKVFDSGVENPCAKMGNGAIPDAADAAIKAKLQAAVDVAETGISVNDEVAAKKAATDAYSMLRAIK